VEVVGFAPAKPRHLFYRQAVVLPYHHFHITYFK